MGALSCTPRETWKGLRAALALTAWDSVPTLHPWELQPWEHSAAGTPRPPPATSQHRGVGDSHCRGTDVEARLEAVPPPQEVGDVVL